MTVAIRIENVSKRYHLGVTHATSLRDLTNGVCGRLFGRSPEHSGNTGARLQQNPCEDEFWALRDISFSVDEGDRLGIIGRNGSGKSTLLKVLSRITNPTRGRVEILGKVASLLEVGTGFHPELTGRENLFLNGTILGMTRAEVARQFDAIINFAGVEKFIDTPVKRYSSGMKVRLGFAVAAHLDPEILIVDEVLAVGDMEFQRKCLGKMDEVARSGRTILFVSHSLSAVTQLCNRGVVLQSGRTGGIQAIEDAVDLYIQQTPVGDREGCFTAELIPDADQILEIRVQQEGADASTVKHDAEIDLVFRVRSPEHRGPMMLRVTICDRFQRRVFTAMTRLDSSDFDGHGDEVMRLLRIRRRFLMAGQYSVSAGLHDSAKHLIDHHSCVCPFGIENVGEDQFALGEGEGGVVFGEFEWLTDEVPCGLG